MKLKNTHYHHRDYSHDVASQQLTSKIEASNYFDIEKLF
jgi:hypothetical protein